MITIYQFRTGAVRSLIEPDEKNDRECGIMKYDQIPLTFKLKDYVEFSLGDYALLFGSKYRLNRPFQYDKVAKRQYEYSMVLEGYYHQLSRAPFLTLNANNHYTEGKFSLREKPLGFLDLVVTSMQAEFPDENWTKGTVVDADYKTLDFDGDNCLSALSKLSTEYDTEFHVVGTTIHLAKREQGTGVILEFGQGKALYKLGRKNQDDNSNPITRLYVYGSTKNIGDNYRNGAPRLRMADSLFIEKDAYEKGVYTSTVVFDGSNGLPEIYPKRIGYVSSVSANNEFIDTSMDFDINDYLMPGVTAKITFNTGLLAGITFEINSYNNGTKSFEINPNTDSQTAPMPSDDFKPAVGDEYVLVDIIMPLAYVNAAEALLKQKGQEYLDKRQSMYSYPVSVNPFWIRSEGFEPVLGDRYQLISVTPPIDMPLRLISFKQNVRNPFKVDIELGETVKPQLSTLKQLIKI